MLLIVVHPGYATGDMFAVSAALAIDANVRVLVTKGRDNDQTDKAESIVDFLRGAVRTGAPDTRVQMIEFEVLRNPTKPEKLQQRDKAKSITGADTNGALTRQSRSLSDVTKMVAEAWGANPDNCRALVRNAWSVDSSQDGAIATWLSSYNGLLKHSRSSRLVVLWSRFSGKKGDVHIEHDTSFTGMRQLIDLALNTPNQRVVITGDTPINPRGKANREHKYDLMTVGRTDRVFNMTGFWNNGMWSGAATRYDQFKLYDYFSRAFHEVRHLGFRSGNLEAIAMIGCGQLRYLEEDTPQAATMGGNRMVPFHGTGMGYERLQITQPPTSSGQYLYDNAQWGSNDWGGDRRRPDWAPGRTNAAAKPAAITNQNYPRGFVADDRTTIGAYLNAPSLTATPPRSPSPSPPSSRSELTLTRPRSYGAVTTAEETTVEIYDGQEAQRCWDCCVIQ